MPFGRSKLPRIKNGRLAAGAHRDTAAVIRSVLSGGALERTRTFTNFFTATSRQRVYQFRHERLKVGSG
jgi:hypothetical protein